MITGDHKLTAIAIAKQLGIMVSEEDLEQVRAEVRARIWEMGRGGGFLLSSSHRLEHDVPTENVLAMIDEAHEYGVYPLPEAPPPGADTGADYEPWSEKKARRRRNEDTVAE